MLAKWIIRINDSGVLGQSTRLRLKKAQQEIYSPKPIWTLDQSWLGIMKFKYNINTRILKLAKELDIEMRLVYNYNEWWFFQEPDRKSKPIIEVLLELIE